MRAAVLQPVPASCPLWSSRGDTVFSPATLLLQLGPEQVRHSPAQSFGPGFGLEQTCDGILTKFKISYQPTHIFSLYSTGAGAAVARSSAAADKREKQEHVQGLQTSLTLEMLAQTVVLTVSGKCMSLNVSR